MRRLDYLLLLAQCKTFEEVDRVADLFIADEDLSAKDFTELCFDAKERMLQLSESRPTT